MKINYSLLKRQATALRAVVGSGSGPTVITDNEFTLLSDLQNMLDSMLYEHNPEKNNE